MFDGKGQETKVAPFMVSIVGSHYISVKKPLTQMYSLFCFCFVMRLMYEERYLYYSGVFSFGLCSKYKEI